jgi:hypothetical protein
MRLRPSLALAVAGAVLLLDAAPGHALAPPAPPPAAVADRADLPTHYLYSGTFTAAATADLMLDFVGVDREERHFTASVAGSIPRVDLTGTESFSGSTAGASVRVTAATAMSEIRTDESQTVYRCEGDSATVTGPPLLIDDLVGPTLRAYLLLSLPTDCADNHGYTGTQTYGLGPIVSELVHVSGRAGDPVLVYRIEGDSTVVPGAPYEGPCPGAVEGSTVTCSYLLNGTLTLRRTGVIGRPLARPCRSSPTVGVDRRARRVRVRITCPATTRARIDVLPLARGRRAVAHRLATIPPRRTVTIVVPVPAARRARLVRSGGVRVRLTYRYPDGTASTEVRRARL